VRQVVEDPEFSITVMCAKHGMGTLAECERMPLAKRLAAYYVIAMSEGLKVDWSSGRTYRENK
jgi:hypothetical protein